MGSLATVGDAFEFSDLAIGQQPDDLTCGPSCLHGVYAFHGLDLPLSAVIESVRRLDHGGTLGVLLGLDALRRGFDATLITYNLELFDPTWFEGQDDIVDRLERQRSLKHDPRLHTATDAYLEFLRCGGALRHEELTPDLIGRALEAGLPPVAGVSATYLYGCAREEFVGDRSRYDPLRGEPVGHFVVVSGYDPLTGRFRISDPSHDNPRFRSGVYWVSPYRILGALLLGVTTYDANLLLIRPKQA